MDPVQAIPEITVRYLERTTSAMPLILTLGVVGALLWAARRRMPPAIPWILLLCAIITGGWLAWGQLALVDDAFISFRYGQNWLDGDGLVYNVGERVEGITNIGWTVLLAGLSRVLSVRFEPLSLVLCGLSWLGCIAVVAALSRDLQGDRPGWLPIAAGLTAVQFSMTAAASTGLESGFGALLGLAGGLAMARRRAGWASLWWILATLVRFDHALFWAVGALWLAGRHARGAWAGVASDRRALVAYALPLTLLGALFAFKLYFYGDILPNTYYAKSADLWYVEQGLVYTWTFWTGSHLWVLIPFALVWPVLARHEERGVAWFATALVGLWHLYVIKVGGDFMYGRFFVAVVPWMLLGAERGVVLLSGSPAVAMLGAALALATAGRVTMFDPYETRWFINDENATYPIISLDPLVIEHHNFRAGHAFEELLYDRGIRVPISTSGIGMVGFYSKLEIVDRVGLTDARIARQPLKQRARPGHEKYPPPGYLAERGVRLARYGPPQKFRVLEHFTLPAKWPNAAHNWYIYQYDEALMRQIAAEVPEIGFRRFGVWVRREYLPTIAQLDRAEALRDLEELDRYYWDLNGPDDLRAEIVSAIEALPTERAPR